MFFKNLCVLVLQAKVASALEGLLLLNLSALGSIQQRRLQAGFYFCMAGFFGLVTFKNITSLSGAHAPACKWVS